MNEDKYNEISYIYLFVSSFKLDRFSLKNIPCFLDKVLVCLFFIILF